MSTAESPAESIYFAALAKKSPQERATYLDEGSAGADSELRAPCGALAARPTQGGQLS